MKLRVLAAATFTALALSACGGRAAPLTLEQRVPDAEVAPGSEPDPVETRVTVTGVDELLADIPSVTDGDTRAFDEAGFVSAVRDARFYPSETGGAHAPDAPHLFTIVLRFESEQGARDAVDQMHQFNLRQCPEVCAFDNSEFDVTGPPNAFGAQRIAIPEALDELDDPGPPLDVYVIDFADGLFVYDIALSGPPDEVSEEEAEEIARRLYDRVRGAPASGLTD